MISNDILAGTSFGAKNAGRDVWFQIFCNTKLLILNLSGSVTKQWIFKYKLVIKFKYCNQSNYDFKNKETLTFNLETQREWFQTLW